jgi:hypothetical protein
VANAPSNLGNPPNNDSTGPSTSTPFKEQQSVPTFSDSIKILMEAQQKQFLKFQSMILAQLKDTNERIDGILEEPASNVWLSSNVQ